VNVHDESPRRAQNRSTHAFLRVVLAAVFNRVHEQFAEGRRYVVARLRRKVGRDLAQEMRGAVGGIDLAPHVQRNPLGPGRNHPDIVLPGVAIERLLHQFTQRTRSQRAVQIAESALPDGRQDALRIAVSGQDDLGRRADGAYPPQ
jgi:hypothetical protein